MGNSQRMENSRLHEILKSCFPDLKEASLNEIVKHSSYLECNKGTKLIYEGKKHQYFYPVIKGAVKSYYSRESREICMWFAFENEIVGTISTYEDIPSKETIELLQDSRLIRFNIKKIRELTKTDLFISHLMNNILTEHALYTEERLYQIQFMTSQESYQTLIETTPEILQKVSLTRYALHKMLWADFIFALPHLLC
jgi:CRP-like cAMP-binding protein|tara:strand:- start:619 stop:1209 length:591 start_codon:yes stop_codon:yes gene_type:complete